MNNQDFSTAFITGQTPAEVFDAICNVRGWWSEAIEGPTEKEGDCFLYHFKEVHISRIRLEQVVPGERIVWHVLDNHFNFIDDQEEWKDTRIIFEIRSVENGTELRFTHQGLTPQYECYEICNDAWTNYIRKSLYDLVRTGQGQPNPPEGGFNSALLDKWKIPG